MDGALPPVDQGSWLDFQRRRAEQVARQRIAAAGATAGDWIGRATSTLDQLVPDWTPPAAPPPPAPEAFAAQPLDTPLPSPAAQVGDWAQGALARIGAIGSDLGAGVQDWAGGVRERAPALTQPETYARAAGIAPLPPGLEGIRPGLQGYTRDAAEAVQTLATDPEAVRAGASTVQRLSPGGLIGTGAELATGQTSLPELGGEALRGAPALGAAATLTPTPGAIGSNVLNSVVKEGALGAGLPAPVATGLGLAADVLTPDPGDAARAATKAPGFVEGAIDALGGVPYRFRQAAADAADEGLVGVRAGQRIRIPRLTPEQQLQRAADGAAEQRVFDAIQQLWRRGPDGEAAADDLRFLAVGKGQEGEAAAREYLIGKGLEDALPSDVPPPGLVPEGVGGPEGLAGLARRATEPFLARGAQTTGERAFDLAAGTAGGVAGAATADEDATWQERAGRFALGSAAGALGGANLRQLGRVGRGALGEDVFGAAAGAAGPAASRFRRPTAAEVADVLSSAPLTAPTSLTANLIGGATRTAERLANELAEIRPIDFAIDAWTTGRTALSPATVRKAGQAFGSGPTPRNPGPTGAASPTGLTGAAGRGAQVLTAGTRGNAATDEVVRTANEAGARAVGERRGLTGQMLEDFVREAGDFATITGPNSPVANAVNKAKSWASDPAATAGQRATGWVATALSPYVSMTERALGATLSAATAPVRVPLQQGAKRLLPSNALTDALTGKALTPRQMMGQMAVGTALDLKLAQLASGQVEGARIYGPPPEDPGLQRDMERQGARWESLVLGDPLSPDARVIPLRNFGTAGQAGSLIASLVVAGETADRKGEDFPKKAERLNDELLAWTLDQSFLSDYAGLGKAVEGRRGTQAIAREVAGIPQRLTSVIGGPLNAADPLERDTSGLAGAVVTALPGGRQLLPAKVDPTTGEAARRTGSGLSRYWGERGTVQTAEAQELFKRDVSPHEFKSGEYAGVKQAPDALRRVKQTVGSETGKAVRATVGSREYQEADDAGKKRLLERALRTADFEAEVRLGDAVKRAPKQQADYEYAAVPRYEGAKKGATPDEVRRYNRSVAEAKAARTEARKKYPGNADKGETEWARANRQQALLAERAGEDAETLRKRRAEIDQKYGVKR